MNTVIATTSAQVAGSSQDVYDPDDVVPRDSPMLQPHRPQLRLSPSPPLQLPLSKVKASIGDAVLISFMDGGKNPQIAATAGTEALPSDISEESHLGETEEDSDDDDEELDSERDERSGRAGYPRYGRRAGDSGGEGTSKGVETDPDSMSVDSNLPRPPQPVPFDLKAVATIALYGQGGAPSEPAGRRNGATAEPHTVSEPNTVSSTATLAVSPEGAQGHQGPQTVATNGISDLKSLAAGALGKLSLHEPGQDMEMTGPPTTGPPTGTPESPNSYRPREKVQALEPSQVVATPMEVPVRDDRLVTAVAPSPYSPNGGIFSPPPLQQHQQGLSPLPPMYSTSSPRSDAGVQGPLPSIRETLRELTEPPVLDARHTPYSHPSPGIGMFPPMSPGDVMYRRADMGSPGHSLAGHSSYYYQSMNGQVRGMDYNSSTSTETPSTEHSASTPATSASINDRMSIDGLTLPQIGGFVCKVPGCNAPPFQTQYLLNSHANVHSSARPHYCPVKGCPRSEGGKGFKRKNEMIRHGLVHESPGYVCPFCPDREHKYPRPDNLQRHVRVHHVDKDRDDPLLREVLSQRPDGPNRGRRRRAVAAGT